MMRFLRRPSVWIPFVIAIVLVAGMILFGEGGYFAGFRYF
jgi:hypothetical protein